MTKEQIATLLTRVEAWPEAAQAELAEVARAIEAELSGEYKPTAGELEGIDRGLQDAAAGRFATREEIEAVFAKHRSA
jgi:predicted transcriptional regulator